MSTAYAEFITSKAYRPPVSGVEPSDLHESLYGFQRDIVAWAVRRGRAAVFSDCGTGKTRMQIEWARQIGGPVLILAPLSVAEQTIAEGAAMGEEISHHVYGPNITITNYERLHQYDPEDFHGIVLDESSILKSVDGKIRTKLIQDWTAVPYRLCCTATPAPNDIAELANHAEFLGVMSRAEMLATFFVHDERDWRLKGHAEDKFWEWMALWSVYVRKPSDLGYSDEGYELPPLTIRERTVAVEHVPDGELFPALAGGIQGRTLARRQSIDERVAAIVDEVRQTTDQWVLWCGLNDEQDAVVHALREAGVSVVSIAGKDRDEDKVARERSWRNGDVQVLASKVAIFGWGMNWQVCHRIGFVGLGDSYEAYYQAIRRCWRFGQKSPVDVVIVTSEAEGQIVQNVRRKEADAERTAARVVEKMRDYERAAVAGLTRDTNEYREDEKSGDGWRMLLGDSCERLKEIEDQSVGLSVFSPPFASLYTYSASDRDLGNSRTYDEFFGHFGYIITELLRVTKPGRRACVHVQQVTTTKVTHGVIGWRDFRADTVRAFIAKGWVYDGEVVIDKDPQAQAIRTKSKSLMFATLDRDSSWLRPAMADYILCFRAAGENETPIHPDVSREEWIQWARPIWYGIRESETLQASSARSDKDEKHIAPLQLETIERCVRLWSNKGDLVLSPFAGIGSEGYVSLQHDRRFIGIELKPEYWEQACRNLAVAKSQGDLFAEVAS